MQDGPAQQSDSVKASGAETKRACSAGEARAMRRCRPPSRDALLRTHYYCCVLSVVASRCVASLSEGAAESGTRESSWARRTSARSSATGPSPRERPRSNVCRSAPLRSALPMCANRGQKRSVAVGCAARSMCKLFTARTSGLGLSGAARVYSTAYGLVCVHRR